MEHRGARLALSALKLPRAAVFPHDIDHCQFENPFLPTRPFSRRNNCVYATAGFVIGAERLVDVCVVSCSYPVNPYPTLPRPVRLLLDQIYLVFRGRAMPPAGNTLPRRSGLAAFLGLRTRLRNGTWQIPPAAGAPYRRTAWRERRKGRVG